MNESINISRGDVPATPHHSPAPVMVCEPAVRVVLFAQPPLVMPAGGAKLPRGEQLAYVSWDSLSYWRVAYPAWAREDEELVVPRKIKITLDFSVIDHRSSSAHCIAEVAGGNAWAGESLLFASSTRSRLAAVVLAGDGAMRRLERIELLPEGKL